MTTSSRFANHLLTPTIKKLPPSQKDIPSNDLVGHDLKLVLHLLQERLHLRETRTSPPIPVYPETPFLGGRGGEDAGGDARQVCQAFSEAPARSGLVFRWFRPGGSEPGPREGEPCRCAGRGRWPHPTPGPGTAAECRGPRKPAAYHQGDVLHGLGVRLGHLPGAQLGGDVSEPSPTLQFLGADAPKPPVLATTQSRDREALWSL